MEKLTKVEGNEYLLERTIGEEEVKKVFRDIYNELRRTAFIPGFRKGKVPNKVLRMKVGGDVIDKEAIRMLVEDDYPQMVAKYDLLVVKEELEDTPIKENEAFTYKMKIWVAEEVELPQYKGNTYKIEKAEVTAEEVEERVKAELDKYAKFKEVEDGIVEKGDLVFIDFEGRKDGELFEGGSAQNYPLEVGKGQFLKDFEDNLLGMKKGEEKTFKLTFPENYGEPSLAGQEVEFRVKVRKIKRKEYPSWDDEKFLKRLKVENKEEYYQKIREKMEEEKKENQEKEKENKVLTDLMGKVEFKNLPTKTIEERRNELIKEFEQVLKYNRMSLEKYLEITQTSPQAFLNHYTQKAENQVKVEMLLKKIAEAEGIEASEEEILKRAKETMQGSSEEKVKETLENNQVWKRAIANTIIFEKVLDFLKENNTFEEVSREELQKEAEKEENKVEEKGKEEEKEANE